MEGGKVRSIQVGQASWKVTQCIVIAKLHDLHADAVVDKLREKTQVIRIDPLDGIPLLAYRGSREVTLADIEVDLSEVTGILCRYALDSVSLGYFEDPVERFAFAEHLAALRGVLQCIAPRKWINYPWQEAIADGKIFPLVLARSYGIRIPEFVVSSRASDLKTFHQAVGSVVIKPLSDSSIAVQADRYVDVPDFSAFKAPYTTPYDGTDLDLDEYDETPTLLQRRVAKVKDVRVVVIDGEILATAVTHRGGDPVDVRIAIDRQEEPVSLSSALCSQVSRYVRDGLKLRFAALDFVVDDQDIWFLVDVNPEGNWLWQEREFHLPITEALTRGLLSATP